jgi:hypothetical protein
MSDTEYDTSDTEYDEDDENVRTVYGMGRFKKFAGKHRLMNLMYYMTYGGGPEGGYVWDKKDNIVYSVNRTMGTPFEIKSIQYNTTIEIIEEEYGFLSLRVIQTD